MFRASRSRAQRSLLGAAVISLALGPIASAHDIWINKERRTNAAGEWCCNTYDCSAIPEEEIKVTPRGYLLENGEMIPHQNAAVSGDGQFWQCRPPRQHHALLLLPPARVLSITSPTVYRSPES